MLDWFKDAVSGSPWAYPVEAGFVWLDGFFPVVPGETVVITAAVLASGGPLVIWLVVLAAFVGAVAGDNVSYLLGAKVGQPAKMLGWGRVQLRERGPSPGSSSGGSAPGATRSIRMSRRGAGAALTRVPGRLSHGERPNLHLLVFKSGRSRLRCRPYAPQGGAESVRAASYLRLLSEERL